MDPFEVTELAERGWRLLMNGYYPNRPDKGMEYYFEWHRADFGLTDLAELMMHLGLAALYPDLSTLLENAALLTPESGQITPPTYGCSLACGADGQIEVFTVFTMTRTFFGGDHRASGSAGSMGLDGRACLDRVLLFGRLCHRRKLVEQCRLE